MCYRSGLTTFPVRRSGAASSTVSAKGVQCRIDRPRQSRARFRNWVNKMDGSTDRTGRIIAPEEHAPLLE